MIAVNGFPKHGTHALAKACELLGQPCKHGHFEGTPLFDHRAHLFIKRDPRNALVSWLRMAQKPVSQGMLITLFRDYGDGKSYIEHLSRFEHWLTEPGVIVVQFERLIATDAEIRRIATLLKTPYLSDAFESLPGLTATWTGRYSDYREHWSDEVQAVWSAEGGDELLLRWGY